MWFAAVFFRLVERLYSCAEMKERSYDSLIEVIAMTRGLRQGGYCKGRESQKLENIRKDSNRRAFIRYMNREVLDAG